MAVLLISIQVNVYSYIELKKLYGVSFFRRGAKLEAALAAVDGVEDV